MGARGVIDQGPHTSKDPYSLSPVWSSPEGNQARRKSHRGPQRACETKFVAVGVNQVEETLSSFGVTGAVVGWHPVASARS
jgi:hypothetical protein